MLGCFTPDHACIDNVIQCRAGVGLRQECREMMDKQKELEPTGKAKLTKGYCLPSSYVIHTVGPIVEPTLFGRGIPTDEQQEELKSCYVECLELCKNEGIRSIAFCCISTGVFGYPQEEAAVIAFQSVYDWLNEGDNGESMDLVLFNVYKDEDLEIYNKLSPKYLALPDETGAKENP